MSAKGHLGVAALLLAEKADLQHPDRLGRSCPKAALQPVASARMAARGGRRCSLSSRCSHWAVCVGAACGPILLTETLNCQGRPCAWQRGRTEPWWQMACPLIAKLSDRSCSPPIPNFSDDDSLQRHSPESLLSVIELGSNCNQDWLHT